MDRHSRRISRAANAAGGGGLRLGSKSSSSTSGLSTDGLSRPRLVKVRRRPTARPGETEVRVVGEKLGSWFPFDDSSRVSAGESVRSENGERSKPEWKGSEEGCKSFVFGSSRSFPKSKSSVVGGDTGDRGVARPGVFVFGSSADTRRTSHLYRNSRGSRSGIGFEKVKGADFSRFGFGEGLGSTLSDPTSGLDIGKTGRDRPRDEVGDDKPEVDKSSTFSFGDNSTVFGQSMTSNLPEKMRSLNIDYSTCGVGFSEAKEDRACKPEVAREHVHHFGINGEVKTSSMKSSSNVFRYEMTQEADGNSFGCSKVTTYSFDEDIASKLPEKIKRLNIENEQKDNQEDGKRDFNVGNDFSETSSKKTHVPAQIVTHDINNSTSTELPDTILKLNTEVSASESSIFGKTDSFVFSSSKNRSGSDNRDEIHKHIGETLLSSGIDNRSIRGLDSRFNCNGSTTDNSTLGESKFQASEQGTSTETGRGCCTNPDYHFVLNKTGSSHQSSVDPGFTSVASDFTFTSLGVGASHMECKTPNKDTPSSSLENIFSEIHRNLAFNSKKGASKDFRLRKRREKLKKVSQDYPNMPTSFVHRDNYSKENSEVGSAGCSSPMDFSPYEEILVAHTHSRPSVSLDDSVPLDSCQTSRSMQQSFSVDDVGDLVSAAQHLGISETDIKGKEPNKDTVKDDVECFLDAKTSFVEEEDDGEEEVCKPGQMYSGSTTENNSIYYSSNNDSIETKFSSSSSTANDVIPGFSFCSSSNDVNQSSFTFAAAFTTQASFSSSKPLHRRKSQKKMGQKSHNSTLNTKFNVESTFLNSSTLSNIPVQTSPTEKHGSEDAPFIFEKITGENKVKPNKRPEFKQEPASSTPESVAVQEACEKWRLRGNQAYAKGNLSKAEEYYTRGVNCVSSNEHSRDCIHALMLCFSNRAATRMSLGRMREALNDSMMAVAIDPNFLKAQVRTANCHLALGETENASELYKKCVEISNSDGSGSKILAEASDGLRNAQLVADYINHSAELLQKKTCDDVINALQMISDALLISPQSEGLIEMKAEALLLLKRYEEVIELCEETVESSQRNSSLFCADGPLNVEEAESKRFLPCKVWRWRLISRSHFHIGRLEEALGLLQKHELVGPISEKYGNKSLEFFASFSITIQELLHLKSAGNDAFQAGRHLDAVEHYTAALTCSIDSRPFAAICFCNRAAAYQGLGQITDAIADCNLAIALDANYPKAISRRATLYESIRDYDQATCDLGRLVSLMEKRSKDKSNQSAAVGGSTKDRETLKQARLRLASIEEEARKGISLNMYTILGIESSSSAADIKKAYRRAALKHHPDKAGQLLVKGENSDDSVWKDVFNEVHMDADRLFKMIGEAYGVLSDPTKRMQYDAEEEMRTILKKGNGMKQRDPEDFQYGRFDRGSNRRYSESPWRSHGSSHQRWSEYSYYSRH